MFEVIFSFVFGAVFYILIVLISYLDSVNFLLKIMKLFSNKKPRGYGDYQKVRQSAQYKNHKNKWIKRKFLLLGIYFILFIIINITTSSTWSSMIISFIATLLIMALKSNKEHAELQEIQKEILSSNII